jgi:hypothetical protein
MASLFDLLTKRLVEVWKRPRAPGSRRSYRCICQRPVFFRNSMCLACKTPLGYECELGRLVPLAPGPEAGLWRLADDVADGKPGSPAALYRRCGNFDSAAGCNWLVPAAAEGSSPALCVACRLNHTIPDLSNPENRVLWQRIEGAKRRLVSQLVSLGLPVASRETEDPQHGLMFDFLRAPPGGPPVTTGHANGLITLDIEEADDVRREHRRTQLHEPYRTLLGHLRHEVGHYYWQRLVVDTPWIEGFRALFGDERANYAAALKKHYKHGARPDWANFHVTSYASVHPWEDWAETWAHYLHMVDTVDTALSFGLDAEEVEIEVEPFGTDALWRADAPGADDFLEFLNSWVELTNVLNELSRSMGQPDFYPFVLPRAAVAKLQLIHCVVTGARPEAAPQPSLASAQAPVAPAA